MANDIAADIASVDAFWADNPKTLVGAPPEFGVSPFNRLGEYEREATWPIADSLGVVGAAQLRFVVRPGLQLGPSISVIFDREAVARLDFVPENECEFNPLWAAEMGLPHRVCGPHFHSWEHNRLYVLKSEVWHLPAREPLQPQIRRFEQAFPWLAAKMNLNLTPEQRLFDVPAQLL